MLDQRQLTPTKININQHQLINIKNKKG